MSERAGLHWGEGGGQRCVHRQPVNDRVGTWSVRPGGTVNRTIYFSRQLLGLSADIKCQKKKKFKTLQVTASSHTIPRAPSFIANSGRQPRPLQATPPALRASVGPQPQGHGWGPLKSFPFRNHCILQSLIHLLQPRTGSHPRRKVFCEPAGERGLRLPACYAEAAVNPLGPGAALSPGDPPRPHFLGPSRVSFAGLGGPFSSLGLRVVNDRNRCIVFGRTPYFPPKKGQSAIKRF